MDVCTSPSDVYTVKNYKDLAKNGNEMADIVKNYTRNELRGKQRSYQWKNKKNIINLLGNVYSFRLRAIPLRNTSFFNGCT